MDTFAKLLLNGQTLSKNDRHQGMASEYKHAKEAFVSNLTGGSISEINKVALVAPASVVLWSVLQSKRSLFTPYTRLACLIDFLLNGVAILLATTLYSLSPVLLNTMLVLPAVLAITPSLLPAIRRARQFKHIAEYPNFVSPQNQPDPFPIKPFVTTYRGTMMVITCVAILAVDFKVFPRRFAKTENWGTSLMDLGVGSFVFSAGTVSARPILKQSLANTSNSLGSRLYAAGRHALPLLVLGIIRLYSVKGLDYAEHVSEYGVHWNFFFTLALLPPFVAMFDAAFSFVPSYAALALLLGVSYEIVLKFTNLKGFILIAPRTNFLSKNREGVFSFLGYLAIFLAGQATGMYTLPRNQRTHSPWRNPILGQLAIWSALWSLLFFLSTDFRFGFGLQVSRRLANLPYILWVVAFNCCQLTLFCGIETFIFNDIYKARGNTTEKKRIREASSPFLRAFNRNGLAIFLLANLITGLVNLTLPTLRMSDLQATAVLLAYIATLGIVALALDVKNISIKL